MCLPAADGTAASLTAAAAAFAVAAVILHCWAVGMFYGNRLVRVLATASSAGHPEERRKETHIYSSFKANLIGVLKERVRK